MTIKTIEISGFLSAFNALRLPFGNSPRSKTKFIQTNAFGEDNSLNLTSRIEINEIDLKLATALVKKGTDHAKIMRGIIVYAEIKAPIYFYRELETYRIGRERLSCESTMLIDCKNLTGTDLQKAKSEIHMGKEQVTIDMYSYQCLRNIYNSRKNHRLPEWTDFCKWIESLPFSKELITC